MAGIWYRAGTVSVTNGSKKVTGFGTQWATSVIKPKKGHAVHAPDGRQYELDYVESDTVMYLVTAYAGATAASQAYSIDITRSDTIPAFSRDLAAFTAYAQGQYDSWQQVLTGTGMVTLTAPDGQQIQVPALSAMQPASASLKAIQALTPVADRLPYFTGANTAATTPLTAAARALLDDSSPADMRETLGLGLLVSVGSFLDFNAPALFGNSVALTSARAAVSAYSPANKPTSSTNWWYTMVYPRATGSNSVYYRQTAISVITGETYERTCISSDGGVTVASFGAWRRVYAQDSILGPVSQAGGVPTGAIVERGSNANGEFAKFADGTLICVASRSLVYTSSSAMLQDTWTLPVPHAAGIGVAMMMAQVTDNATRKYNRASPSGVVAGGATTSVIMRLWATGTDTFVSGDATTPLPFLFIGRWY